MQDGRISHLDHVFLRGSRIRFMIIPDMLKNAPMFKRIDPKHKVGSAFCLKEGTVCPFADVLGVLRPHPLACCSILIVPHRGVEVAPPHTPCATIYILCEQAKNVATGVGGRGRAVAARAKAKAAAGAAGGPGPGRGRGM